MVRSRAALLTLEALAEVPRWPSERTAGLTGRVRGVALTGWAANVRRRWGHPAASAVREAIGLDSKAFPDDPPRDSWWPAALHLRATEAIVDTCLAGDARRLVVPWREDVERHVPAAARLGARLLGTSGLLKRTLNAHRWVYDVGHLRGRVDARSATLDWSGAPLFSHPTCRLLLSMAIVAAVELSGADSASIAPSEPGPDAFRLDVRW